MRDRTTRYDLEYPLGAEFLNAPHVVGGEPREN